MKRQVEQIDQDLKHLTEQLNKFKPASSKEVLGRHEKLSALMEARLDQQSARIDSIAECIASAQ